MPYHDFTLQLLIASRAVRPFDVPGTVQRKRTYDTSKISLSSLARYGFYRRRVDLPRSAARTPPRSLPGYYRLSPSRLFAIETLLRLFPCRKIEPLYRSRTFPRLPGNLIIRKTQAQHLQPARLRCDVTPEHLNNTNSSQITRAAPYQQISGCKPVAICAICRRNAKPVLTARHAAMLSDCGINRLPAVNRCNRYRFAQYVATQSLFLAAVIPPKPAGTTRLANTSQMP